jgi:hypothetical protein
VSIYKALTDSFLTTRRALPESTWNDQIHAVVDEYFEEAAVKVYSNHAALENFNEAEYIAKIDKNISKIYQSKGLEYPEKFPLTGMLLELEFNYPLMNVFGMALADGDTEKLSETWAHCIHAIWYEFSKCLKEAPSKESTLRLCRTLDLIDEFESLMISLEFFSDNYVPLGGIDYWFGDISKLADKFLTHDDILNLSKSAGTPTLVSMHSSVPTAKWLSDEFTKGVSFLANNPNLPSNVVNIALLEREWGLSDKVLLHPNANTENAINWIIEILDSGEGEELINSLREWDNVRDDAFNNFNSYRSTSASGKKVLAAIKKWCKENPDEGEEIYDVLFE